MKFKMILICLAIGTYSFAQDFYDLKTIQTIEITFAQSNWDQLMDIQKQGDENYIMAQSVSINGEVFDSVGVKYKGNSTYNPNQTKNPLHIELDTYKSQNYQGYKDIKLSNVAKDPSFLREVLSYEVLGKYMDAPLSNYANVYINGSLYGLYTNSESITKTFVDDRYGSKDNTFIKCNPIDGAGPQSSDRPDLTYLGQDSTQYYAAYELKSDGGWQDLIDLCEMLQTDVTNIETILDVDRVLWMLAFDNALVNLDSYIGSFAQNYYLYMDDNGRFVPVVWDLNESFAGFTRTNNGSLNSNTAKQRMSHLLNLNETDVPLVNKLLAIPQYRRMYLAHYKTMLLENFDSGAVTTLGKELQELIDESVSNDPYKFFTYNNFLSNLDSDVSGGGGGPGGNNSTIGITNLMDERTSYLLSLDDFTATQPTISDVATSNNDPKTGESLYITATIENSGTVYLGVRNDKFSTFEKIQMLDDGNNGDGGSGDGVYGVEITVDDIFTQYYIYAENDEAGKFSPVRAEFEYYVITAESTNTDIDGVVINEFMASNDASVADQDGEYDDWIELYNNSNNAIDLSGYNLSDDPTEINKWTFPQGTTIGADSYLIIWADNDEEQEGLHASFKLSASSESVVLSDAGEQVIDEVTYVDQITDQSYSRYPNGIGNFRIQNHTYNANNGGSVNTVDKSQTRIEVFPNPVEDFIYLKSKTEIQQVSVINNQGLLVKSINNPSKTLDLTAISSGAYILLIKTASSSLTYKIIKM